jgi:thiamine biosynthesis lipoprotein
MKLRFVLLAVVATACAKPAARASDGAAEAGAPSTPVVAAPPAPRVLSRTYGVMGTEARFTIFTADEARADRTFGAAYDEIRRIEVLMTDWERPGEPESDVVRINKAAGKAPVKVSPETIAVIEKSLEMSRRSEGAFDITYAAMRGLWKFDEEMDRTLPAPAEIARRRKLIDWRQVVVDPKASTVMLRKKEMKLGLGGIAKGYAVDRCAAVLRGEGFHDFMVQAGGDLFVSGRKGTANWMVGVRDPRGGPAAVIAKMAIENQAFSTAGDYERSFILNGRRYHHIIDPKTGYPATASRGVTILAPDAFVADALDDAVFILGPEKGLKLVASYPGCAAVIVDRDNRVWTSPSLEGKLVRTAAPTDGI